MQKERGALGSPSSILNAPPFGCRRRDAFRNVSPLGYRWRDTFHNVPPFGYRLWDAFLTLQPVTGGQTTYANGRIAAPCFSIAYRADRAYRSLSSERIPIASIVSSTPQFRLYIKLSIIRNVFSLLLTVFSSSIALHTVSTPCAPLCRRFIYTNKLMEKGGQSLPFQHFVELRNYHLLAVNETCNLP